MAAMSGGTNRPDLPYAAPNSHLGLTSTTPTRTADRAAIPRGRCAPGAADHLGPSVPEGELVSIAEAPQPAQPNRRRRLARRIRIVSARLRPLTWKGARLTVRQSSPDSATPPGLRRRPNSWATSPSGARRSCCCGSTSCSDT
jgi:hypothetical protein